MVASFRSGFGRLRELALAIGPALLLVVAAFWITLQFVRPAPPTSFVIATASKSSPYHRVAESYKAILEREGITLEIRETSGSIENLRLLADPGSGVLAGFVQGGISNAKQANHLRSLGRLFYEPLWIFYQGPEAPERLIDLAGKRLLVGPAGGGTNLLAMRLLAANDITPGSATLINMELPDYVEALEEGRADAGFLVLAPDARTIRRLLASPKARLMNLARAEAYTQRFPFLTKLELKQGVVDFAKSIPPRDTTMVATTAALLVHENLHPALANLLTQAVIASHAEPVLDDKGEAGLFQRVGEFPVANDPEFPLSEDARHVFKSGPPFLQRYLPFWLATLADRMLLMLLPVLGILIPMLRLAPMLYTWRIRRRILFYYRLLKRFEAGIDANPGAAQIAEKQKELDRIEESVDRIPVPLGFASQIYDLKEHIDGVRRRCGATRTSILGDRDARVRNGP